MNPSLRRYRACLTLLTIGMIACGLGFIALLIVFDRAVGPLKLLWIVPFALMFAFGAVDVVLRRTWPEKIIFRDCDIVGYTRVKSNVYDKFGSGSMMVRRMKITLRIDFFSGNYLRVADTPKRIPLVYLHTMPEFLMYYAFAALMKDNRAGVDCANTYITDHRYFHHNRRKADPRFAVAFAVTRYTACMMDQNFDAALRVFQGIKVPPSYKALDVLVRYCRAHAEEAQGHVKNARGLYAYVGRNANNLYLGRNAEFLRTQLLSVPEGTVAHVKNLLSEAEIVALAKDKKPTGMLKSAAQRIEENKEAQRKAMEALKRKADGDTGPEKDAQEQPAQG